MKQRYRLIRRGERNTYYYFDNLTKKRSSLGTEDPAEAERLITAKNEASRQPAMNLELARVYLQHSDPAFVTRTWQHVMTEMGKSKSGNTKTRWDTAMNDKAFAEMRELVLIKTQAEHLLEAMHRGTVSTNVFLRRLHNFALDMNWIPKSIIPRRQWPKIEFKPKRAITWEEHERIIARERNSENRAFYELLWHFGGAQTDMATLSARDIDWTQRTIAYARRKTGTPVIISFGFESEEILKTLPKTGLLFPRLAGLHEKHRAMLFRQRCGTVGVSGVTLHSYRYAWAERARVAGVPERFAQEALGHNSAAVHRAYAKGAKVKIPSLEEYEKKIVPMPMAVNQ